MSDPSKNLPQPSESPSDAEIEEQVEETAEAEASSEDDDPHHFLIDLYELERSALQGKRPLEDSKAEYERKQRDHWLKEAIDLHGLRQRYTGHLFTLTCVWLVFVLVFVGFTGFKGKLFIPINWNYPILGLNLGESECANCWRFYFSLSDKVLIAFITSTTASVIGIFLIVAKWLFPYLPKPEEKKDPK